ncbi:hypothetical protein PT974_01402 [Cladobotryum mycophilum]|uniref:Uncharacterized protein n=1 Tax=Cladobotryum mycophilum TaxID=491253 RepID=A0ABR0T505_9HYPO
MRRPAPLHRPLATGFNIPASLENGIYEVSFYKEFNTWPGWPTKKVDKPIVQRIVIAHYDMSDYYHLNVTAKYNDDRVSMPITHSRCPGPHDQGTYMKPSQMQMAREMLGNWCELYDPRGGGAVIAVYGDAVYYICNWTTRSRADSGRTCSAWEAHFTDRKLDQWCGPGHNGFLQLGKWGIDYGRTQRDVPICGNIEMHEGDKPTGTTVRQPRRKYKFQGGSGRIRNKKPTKVPRPNKGKWKGREKIGREG